MFVFGDYNFDEGKCFLSPLHVKLLNSCVDFEALEDRSWAEVVWENISKSRIIHF